MTPGTWEDRELRERKNRLRREIRETAAALTAEYRTEASRRITEQVLALESWRTARVVMAYASLPTEPDTRRIIQEAVREGKTVLLPRCVSPVSMTAFPFTGWENLEPGWLGISEPRVPVEETAVPEPDLILVPCVTASPDGRRLGHGAGYYDRFLENRSGKTVCLCFRKLMRKDIPTGSKDRLIGQVITD